jgi:hypothetical protein
MNMLVLFRLREAVDDQEAAANQTDAGAWWPGIVAGMSRGLELRSWAVDGGALRCASSISRYRVTVAAVSGRAKR